MLSDVLVVLEGLEVKEKFYLSDLRGVDLILGVSWLASLGEVKINWSKLTTSFAQGEREVMIRGDPTLARKVVAPEALLKETEIEAMTLVGSREEIELEEKEGRVDQLSPRQST